MVLLLGITIVHFTRRIHSWQRYEHLFGVQLLRLGTDGRNSSRQDGYATLQDQSALDAVCGKAADPVTCADCDHICRSNSALPPRFQRLPKLDARRHFRAIRRRRHLRGFLPVEERKEEESD